ncbi:hypothetical protein HG535_0B02070 [Zygotorulaspora mrakii]|uniref:Rrp15p-domain-containing protein n=1 Tax=Zygotorulaspora mrakii TaxID=42260 RepID=A0A7H9AZL8_ZYGMR|nr:uncharacterized protein HG535_0B02070 [Zygotorulaspora mrakii]QLG71169.1 hypothetical protein HG535_0B02070 [Zygotorulaspora mrakii]
MVSKGKLGGLTHERGKNSKRSATSDKETSSDRKPEGVKNDGGNESAHESTIESSASESDEDSEVDVTDSSDEEEDQFPLKKKSKKSKHDDGSNDFSGAVNAILSSHLKAYDRNDPIMARNKKVLKQNESDKLEQKAKKALLAEKKKKLEKARNKDVIPKITDDAQSGEEIRKVLERETRLRKIARKGAVKLFNAILSTQVKTEKDAKTKFGDIKNVHEREQLITDVSKERFLDMVKAAGEED